MAQETNQIERRVIKTSGKASSHSGQTFSGILHLFWGTIRKVTAATVEGFHIFVQSGEIKEPTHDQYWWNSPDHVDDLFKH